MEQIILHQILPVLDNKLEKPLFVAIHGPQGCGKSTTCSNIQNIFVVVYLKIRNKKIWFLVFGKFF